MEYMKTLAAMHCQKKIKNEVAVVEITLFKIVDVADLIQLCFCFNIGNVKGEDKPLAKTIHEDSDLSGINFSRGLENIDMFRKINISMPSGATSIEFFEENQRGQKSRTFRLE